MEQSLRKTPPAVVVAIANQKGGVGKTTSAINLGAALAMEEDRRVLLVDLDPQANATSGLGVKVLEEEQSLFHVVVGGVPVIDVIEPTKFKNLFVVPANGDLADAELNLVTMMSRERRLTDALQDVINDYDVILLDCPPSLGLLTINALAAAHEVLIPVQCEYYALEGLSQLRHNIDMVRKSLNPHLHIGGVVLTMFDGRTNLSSDVANEIRAHFRDKAYRTVIPRSVRLSEAPSYGEPIQVYDRMSSGAIAYRYAAKEFCRRHLGQE